MERNGKYKNAESWVNQQLAHGRYAFPIEQFRTAFADKSEIATKFALKRLSDKQLVTSIHKGYYLIIPPQYSNRGVLPPQLFLDGLMQSLGRPYYLALLNAAAYYGAGHQQPQEFFVITRLPTLRPLEYKGLKINFISRETIPAQLLRNIKTEAGYLAVSSPVLTAADLVLYEKRIGGLSRVATVLSELQESISPADFDLALISYAPIACLQRVGYLLDRVLDNQTLADALYEAILNSGHTLFRTPLKTTVPTNGKPSDNRWKVIMNTVIEVDE